MKQLFFIGIICIIILYLNYKCTTDKDKEKAMQHHLCHGKLTDKQFLEHMIPHHQMAIDTANQILKYTTDPAIVELARNIIWAQEYEIWYMNFLLRGKSYTSTLMKDNPELNIIHKSPLSQYYPDTTQDHKTKGTCPLHLMTPCTPSNNFYSRLPTRLIKKSK